MSAQKINANVDSLDYVEEIGFENERLPKTVEYFLSSLFQLLKIFQMSADFNYEYFVSSS